MREGKGRCGSIKKCKAMCGRVYWVSLEDVRKCVGKVRGEVWGKVRGDVGVRRSVGECMG